MFSDTLLDSSPEREPALQPVHRLIAIGAAGLGFPTAFFVLPLVEPAVATKVLVVQAAAAGLLAMFHAVMLCYVHADARHLGLGRWPWFAITLALSLVGFLAYLVCSAAKTGDWRRAALPAGYVLELALVGALVLIPLVHSEALPTIVWREAVPMPPPPPSSATAPAVEARVQRHTTVPDILHARVVIPRTVSRIVDTPELPRTVGVLTNGLPGGVPNGVPGGVPNSIFVAGGGPPPPAPPTRPNRTSPMRVGGVVEAAKLLFKPKPEYPPLAKAARIQGTVHLEAVIGRDGTIEHLKAVSGHPLLVNAAMQAVERWRYQPTQLNGEPVDVVTDIEVKFVLAE